MGLMKQVEILVNIFTIEDEEIKVLLMKKQTEPFKGYWLLPKTNVSDEESINDIAQNILLKLGLENTSIYQYHAMSDFSREPGSHFISISYVGFLDIIQVKINETETKYEKEWFSIDKLPKMAYNHVDIVFNNLNFLRNELKKSTTLQLFFPSDFSLPELQRVYENLYDIKIDRRNFRKKFLQNDLLEETGEYTEDSRGRPAKLYMFKPSIPEVNIL